MENMKPQLISLFAGIEGFGLAGELAGYELVVSCEINPWCQIVNQHHFPGAYHHGDIKTLNRQTIENKSKWNPLAATIVVGGFP